MASSYKVLAQSSPSQNVNTDIYTVPAGANTVCSTMVVCNRGATAQFRVAVRPAGAAISNQHYIVFDTWVDGTTSIFLTLGITLANSDVVTVYSANTANISYSLFGTEVTA